MVDVWKELGKAVGRAFKPIADLAAAIWKSLGDAASDLAERFFKGAEAVGDAVEPYITPAMEKVMEEATESLMPGSPKEEIKEAAKKLTAALMKALEDNVPKKGESPPSLEVLLASVAGLIGTNVGLFIAGSSVGMALDGVHPVKQLGFRQAASDIMMSFEMPAMIGPTLQAPVWSGVIAPLRMRWNQRFPYLVPGTGVLPHLRAKDIIDGPAYTEAMSYHAHDKDWAEAELANAWRYPSFSELRTMIHRGVKTWDDARAALKLTMIHADYVDAFQATIPSIPSVSDLVRFAVREAYPDAVTFEEHYAKMTEWIGKIGYSTYFADAFWTAHWIIPSPGQADELLHRGEITEEEHTALYILNDIRPKDIPNLRKLTWALPGAIEARWMFRYGEIDVTGLRDLLIKGGKDPKYADSVAKAVAKVQFEVEINKLIDNYKRDYAKGYSTETGLRDSLAALAVPSAFVEYHVRDAVEDRIRSARDERLRMIVAQYRRKALTMAQVVEKVELIIIDPDTRTLWLESLPELGEETAAEETYTTEVNRLVANAKYDYIEGYIKKGDLVSRLELLDLTDEAVKLHVMDADEDRERKHNDRQLAIVEEAYVDDKITWEEVEEWARTILVDEAARGLYLDEVWLNKHKAKRE